MLMPHGIVRQPCSDFWIFRGMRLHVFGRIVVGTSKSVPVFLGVCDSAACVHVREDQRAAYTAHRASLKNSPIEIILRKARSRKSQEQLGWYWGCILPMLAELTGHDVDELHAYCTQKFLNPPERKTLVISDKDGVVVDEADVQLYPDRVHLLTTGQMADFCEDIRMWAAADLRLVIPDPDKRWREHRRAA